MLHFNSPLPISLDRKINFFLYKCIWVITLNFTTIISCCVKCLSQNFRSSLWQEIYVFLIKGIRLIITDYVLPHDNLTQRVQHYKKIISFLYKELMKEILTPSQKIFTFVTYLTKSSQHYHQRLIVIIRDLCD